MSDVDKAQIISNIVNYSYNVAQEEVLDIEISKTYQKANIYSKIGDISDYYIVKSNDFESDKDKNGKTISGSKKEKVINYINSMNLSIPEKAILIKMNNYNLEDYNKEIINYINSKELSSNEKIEILKELGFTIKDGRVYY